MAGDPGSIRMAKAYVELGTDDKGLVKGLDAAKAQVAKFGQSIMKVGAMIQGLGDALAAPFVAAANHFAQTGEELANMSARTGASVEALSTLSFAASQTGTDLGMVEVGLKKMQKAMVEAASGGAPMQALFGQLGLSLEQLGAMNTQEQFAAIADALSNIQSPAVKAAYALKLFGKSGTQLLPLMDNLRDLSDEAKDFGLVMSGDAAQAGHELGRSMKLLQTSIGSLMNTIGSVVAESFQSFYESMARIIKTAKDWINANRPLIAQMARIAFEIAAAGVAIVAFGAVISTVASLIGGLVAVVGTIVSVFGALTSAVSVVGLLTSPITILIALVGGLALAFVYFKDEGGAALSWIGAKFAVFQKDAEVAMAGISDALKAGNIQLAAQILWAALKVEWYKGTLYLKQVWADWGVAILQGFDDASTTLASKMIDMWSFIQKMWINGKTGVLDLWYGWGDALKNTMGDVVNFVLSLWDEMIGGVNKALIKLQGMVQASMKILDASRKGLIVTERGREWLREDVAKIGMETGGAIGRVDQSLAEKKAARAQAATGVVGGQISAAAQREIDRKKAEAGVEATRAAQQEALAGATDPLGRKKESDKDIAASQKELTAAQAELAGLVGEAAAKAEDVTPIKKAKLGGPGADEEGLTPKAIDEGMKDTKEKIDVKGGFNAAAFGQLGFGDTMGEQVKEQKKTNDKLDKINTKMDQGALIMGA